MQYFDFYSIVTVDKEKKIKKGTNSSFVCQLKWVNLDCGVYTSRNKRIQIPHGVFITSYFVSCCHIPFQTPMTEPPNRRQEQD